MLRRAALVIGCLWAGWWTFFGAASGVGEGMDAVGVILHMAVPGLVFAACVGIAWRYSLVGVGLLLASGLGTLVNYSFASSLPGFFMLPLPPLVAAALLFAHWWQHERPHGSPLPK